MKIPPAYLRRCHLQFDGCAVDTRAADNGQRVSGYAINRDGGGSTALKEPTGEWACRWCLDRLRHPHHDDPKSS